MKFSLVGAGSIGRRHLRNLAGLGHRGVALLEPNEVRARDLVADFPDLQWFPDESEFWRQNCDGVLICSPTAQHPDHVRAAIRAGRNFFLEKPISGGWVGLDELNAEYVRSGLRSLVACNLRFTPELKHIKTLLDENSVGRVLTVQARFGYYLPDWRPGSDYRETYAVRKESGGGVILDTFHEFDYLIWLFGGVNRTFCMADKISALELETEDNADVLLHFENGTRVNLHLDYLQRMYNRGCDISGEEGTLTWDFTTHTVVLASRNDRRQQWNYGFFYDLNGMYVNEMKHFLAVIGGAEISCSDFSSAMYVQKVVMAARESAETGRILFISKFGEEH